MRSIICVMRFGLYVVCYMNCVMLYIMGSVLCVVCSELCVVRYVPSFMCIVHFVVCFV